MPKIKSPSFALALITAALFCSGVSAQTSIISVASSKCLQVRNSNFKDGTAVEMSDCNGSTSQKWSITDRDVLTTITLADPNLQVQFCLDAKTTAESSKVVIWECNEDPWQQWNFTSDGRITLIDPDLCLDVTGGSTANGVQVETYPCNRGSNQMWTTGA